MLIGALIAANLTLPPPSGDAKLVINELGMLDSLIEVTERNLQRQKELRKEVLLYQEDLALYLKHSSDKDVVLKVAKRARRLLEGIKNLHLIEAFEPDFISELTLFAQIAQKRSVPKP